MSRPYNAPPRHVSKKTPFYFIIVFHIKLRRSILIQILVEFSPSSRLLVSALAVYATAFGPMFPLHLAKTAAPPAEESTVDAPTLTSPRQAAAFATTQPAPPASRPSKKPASKLQTELGL